MTKKRSLQGHNMRFLAGTEKSLQRLPGMSLRGRRFVLFFVTVRSYIRFRSSLAFHSIETASLCSQWQKRGLLRRSAPRSDKKEVLAGTQQGIPRRDRKELAATSWHVTAGSSFRPFLRHCEVVVSSFSSSLRGRIFVSEAVSPFCPNKRVSAQGLLRSQ